METDFPGNLEHYNKDQICFYFNLNPDDFKDREALLNYLFGDPTITEILIDLLQLIIVILSTLIIIITLIISLS